MSNLLIAEKNKILRKKIGDDKYIYSKQFIIDGIDDLSIFEEIDKSEMPKKENYKNPSSLFQSITDETYQKRNLLEILRKISKKQD